MNLRRKLERLEQRIKPGGCSLCRGRGRGGVFVRESGRRLDPAVSSCPRCGANAAAVRVIVVPKRAGNPYPARTAA